MSWLTRAAVAVAFLVVPAFGQKTAVLTPDKAERSVTVADAISERLSEKLTVLDPSLAEAAYGSVSPATPFNLTAQESKRIGAAIGCDAFIIVRAANQRRSAFGRDEYYEAYAVVYVVSSRSGRLILWKLATYDAAKPREADKRFFDAVSSLADEIAAKIGSAIKLEIGEPEPLTIEEVPDEASPLARNFRAPVPYRRIKPEYTLTAALYDVTATIDALVDLDASGTVRRIEFIRWAGFGLEESVENAIRTMNWRPAERNGKPLPMRFLLRYNFKKLDKDQSPGQ